MCDHLTSLHQGATLRDTGRKENLINGIHPECLWMRRDLWCVTTKYEEKQRQPLSQSVFFIFLFYFKLYIGHF